MAKACRYLASYFARPGCRIRWAANAEPQVICSAYARDLLPAWGEAAPEVLAEALKALKKSALVSWPSLLSWAFHLPQSNFKAIVSLREIKA